MSEPIDLDGRTLRCGTLGSPRLPSGVQRGSGQDVEEALSCGEGVAAALCRACGLDPDEMVGDDGEGEE